MAMKNLTKSNTRRVAIEMTDDRREMIQEGVGEVKGRAPGISTH